MESPVLNVPIRILKIKTADGKDEVGRELGSDWLLASFGWDENTEHLYYLTTNCVNGDKLMELEERNSITPADLAHILFHALQDNEIRERLMARPRFQAKPKTLSTPIDISELVALKK